MRTSAGIGVATSQVIKGHTEEEGVLLPIHPILNFHFARAYMECPPKTFFPLFELNLSRLNEFGTFS